MALLHEMDELESSLRSMSDEAQSEAMSAYLGNRFPFLGVKTPGRRAAVKASITTARTPSRPELVDAVDHLWAMQEREFHQCAVDILRRWQRVLVSEDIDWLGRLVTTNSWWDTVDALATHPVAHLVRNDRSLRQTIDRWATSENLWLNRTAIIHQLLFKDDTDVRQLFDYCDLHASSTEFFHRKAIGWALRQYARTDPDAVQDYVDTRLDVLSGLSIREALKHLQPR